MWRAFVETPNFSFEAYAAEEAHAHATLVSALELHAKRRHIENPDAWVLEVVCDAQTYEIGERTAFIDREPIDWREAR